MLNNRYRFVLFGKRTPPVDQLLRHLVLRAGEPGPRGARATCPRRGTTRRAASWSARGRRTNYLGMFEENQLLLSYNLGGPGDDASVKEFDYFVRLKNPVWLRSPSQSQRLEVFRTEGRWGGLLGLGVEPARSSHVRPHAQRRREPAAGGYRQHRLPRSPAVHRCRHRRADDGLGHPEPERRSGSWAASCRSGGGLVFNRDGLAAVQPDLDQFYFRGEIEGTARREIAKKLTFAGRLYGGVAVGAHTAAKQRQIYLGSSDPFAAALQPVPPFRGRTAGARRRAVPGAGRCRRAGGRLPGLGPGTHRGQRRVRAHHAACGRRRSCSAGCRWPRSAMRRRASAAPTSSRRERRSGSWPTPGWACARVTASGRRRS